MCDVNSADLPQIGLPVIGAAYISRSRVTLTLLNVNSCFVPPLVVVLPTSTWPPPRTMSRSSTIIPGRAIELPAFQRPRIVAPRFWVRRGTAVVPGFETSFSYAAGYVSVPTPGEVMP